MSESNSHVICPYCGHVQNVSPKCSECGGLFEPLSVKATQIGMGPWFIRDRNRPFQPGCSFQVLQRLLAAGRVKPTTVLRGPTTHQLWEVARNVPGVAHLLGYCHKCNARVLPADSSCAKCHAVFTTPKQRDELGLYYKTDDQADAALVQMKSQSTAKNDAVKSAKSEAVTIAGSSPAKSEAAVDSVKSSSTKSDSHKSKSSKSKSRGESPGSQNLLPGEDILSQIIGPLQGREETHSEPAKTTGLGAREQSAPTHKHGADVLLPPTDDRTTTTGSDAEPAEAVGLSERSEFYADKSEAPMAVEKKSRWSEILLGILIILLFALMIYWMRKASNNVP